MNSPEKDENPYLTSSDNLSKRGTEKYLPVDPSNTAEVGKDVEQGIVKIKEGISEQSSEWEDEEERDLPASIINPDADKYIKDPSPEENEAEEHNTESA